MNLRSLVGPIHKWTSTLIVEWEPIICWITSIHIHWEAAIVILILLHERIKLLKILLMHGRVCLIVVLLLMVLLIISLRLRAHGCPSGMTSRVVSRALVLINRRNCRTISLSFLGVGCFSLSL